MKYLFFLISPLFIYAQTTMCYKNNWSDLSTIEKQKFDGGECKGEKSIGEMKKDGWLVKDIKIATNDGSMNFIYILNKEKKEETVSSEALNYSKIAEALEDKKKEKKDSVDLEEGKTTYLKICQRCHGQMGELRANGASRALNSLSVEDMRDSIRGYRQEEYDRGMAFIMKPYTNFATSHKLHQIKLYLNSVNK